MWGVSWLTIKSPLKLHISATESIWPGEWPNMKVKFEIKFLQSTPFLIIHLQIVKQLHWYYLFSYIFKFSSHSWNFPPKHHHQRLQLKCSRIRWKYLCSLPCWHKCQKAKKSAPGRCGGKRMTQSVVMAVRLNDSWESCPRYRTRWWGLGRRL